jgi:hypothetical protein
VPPETKNPENLDIESSGHILHEDDILEIYLTSSHGTELDLSRAPVIGNDHPAGRCFAFD